MSFFISFFKKIWKDSVGSKVIAEGFIRLVANNAIWIIGGFAGLGAWLFGFWGHIREGEFFLSIEFVLSHPWQSAIFAMILAAIVFGLWSFLWRLRSQSDSRLLEGSGSLRGTEYLQSLSTPSEYYFLLWFPVNETMNTESFKSKGLVPRTGQVSIDHLPIIRKCMKYGLLRIVSEGLSSYTYEVDSDVYEFLEEELSEMAEQARVANPFADPKTELEPLNSIFEFEAFVANMRGQKFAQTVLRRRKRLHIEGKGYGTNRSREV